MAKTPSPQDVLGCQAALFEWSESYDSKDWERLRGIVAPTLRIDYRTIMNKLWEEMPADEFLAMASNPHFLGDPTLKTQHFVGNSRWVQESDEQIIGYHQLRVAHQRYTDASLKTVTIKGHAHGSATMVYRKVEDTWKFAGLTPNIRWFEYDYDQIFGAPPGDDEGKDARAE